MIIINQLYSLIKQRQKYLPEKSYTASLFRQGADRIIQKVGEEAIETVIAAKSHEKKKIIAETADLLFHLLVMLAALDITPDDIEEELEKRKQ